MAASVASDQLQVQSHRGPYKVYFRAASEWQIDERHFFVDANVARLHVATLAPVLASGRALVIEANERAKSLAQLQPYVDQLLNQSVRRDQALVAIGGGVIQDITSFLAATLLRGMVWEFYPTTLLAQADSCIGSKSSINVGDRKNILGTFTPPRSVVIDERFLKTLSDQEIRSGIGEILKVSAIDGPETFNDIANRYDDILAGGPSRGIAIRKALAVKKAIIELDEFDTGHRRVMNYGHSFGHAIEAATDFAIPHGIAVTIGMDMANHVATRLGRLSQPDYVRMHTALKRNYAPFSTSPIPADRVIAALKADKKNTADRLLLILPNSRAQIEPVVVEVTAAFLELCSAYLAKGRLE